MPRGDKTHSAANQIRRHHTAIDARHDRLYRDLAAIGDRLRAIEGYAWALEARVRILTDRQRLALARHAAARDRRASSG